MSVDTKFLKRPKVRFCHTDTGESTMKELVNSTDQIRESQHSNKPKIKSIITLDEPVKLVKLNETAIPQQFGGSKSNNNDQNINSLLADTEVLSSSSIQSSAPLSAKLDKAESQTPLNNANNVQNIKANSKEVDVRRMPIKPSGHGMTPSDVSHIKENERLKKIFKGKDCIKSNPIKRDCIKVKKGKENEATVAKETTKAGGINSSDSNLLKHKPRPCPIGNSTKLPNITGKSSVSYTTKRNLSSKFNVIGVMPCHKHNKVASKKNALPVRKTVIRDVIGPKIKPFIGPGVSHEKLGSVKLPKADEGTHTKSIVSGEQLARPEYNSIMCTINKLNEMKKQAVVTDIEHLPPLYKNLVNGKISTALDFPLDEAIYKNLVDLTVDENQLPNRLTRSKDPEPRQRDVIPVLRDFFTPAPTEEYCTAVCIKPRALEMVDSWSPFRISDQICEWKYILDHA